MDLPPLAETVADGTPDYCVSRADDVNHAWLAFVAKHGLDTVAAANTSRLATVRKPATPSATEPGAT